jgi:hypothetical protein
MALSFAADIRPLFLDDPDVDTMKGFGLDLASYAEVKDKAQEIYATLEEGRVCPATRLGRRKMWRYSSAGSMKVWPPERRLSDSAHTQNALPPQSSRSTDGIWAE